jgi:predicted esterase
MSEVSSAVDRPRLSFSLSPASHRTSRLGLGFALGILGLAAAAVPVVATTGWQKINLPVANSYMYLYIPSSVHAGTAAPLIVFLHGSGDRPEDYLAYVGPASEASGSVLALPKSSSDLGWGVGNDPEIVAAAQTVARAATTIDPRRVSISGHSAGGAYAYLLAYGPPSGYSAVFSLSAPFYQVSALADLTYTAPIRMYFGSDDPNFSGGGAAQLTAQWNRLKVPSTLDLQAGFGHSTWPQSSMNNGFQFLVSQTYTGTTPTPSCAPDATHLCLLNGRYRAAVAWQTATSSGVGTVTTSTSDASGVFWFFAADNWEMLVKMVDGCAVNQRVWVFTAATTNVGFTLTVQDTVLNTTKTYTSAVGAPAVSINDVDAFATCS